MSTVFVIPADEAHAAVSEPGELHRGVLGRPWTYELAQAGNLRAQHPRPRIKRPRVRLEHLERHSRQITYVFASCAQLHLLTDDRDVREQHV